MKKYNQSISKDCDENPDNISDVKESLKDGKPITSEQLEKVNSDKRMTG